MRGVQTISRKVDAYLDLIRVEQWYKNLMIAVPAVFSLKLVDLRIYPLLAVGFLTLSAAASSVYAFNDIADLQRDKLHPRKRERPLPSGRISVREAAALSAALAVLSLATAYFLGRSFVLCVAAYICLSFAYSLALKHVAVVDVTAIALNYLLRVVSGAFLLEVEVSPWLVTGIFFLALFLALSKRKAEYRLSGARARESLREYNIQWLDQALSMTTAMTIVTYAVYCAEVPLGRRLIPTVPVMAFFLLRYTLALEKGVGEHPHEVIVNDKPTLLSAIMLIASVLLLAYVPW